MVLYGPPKLALTGHSTTGRGIIAARLNDVSETGEALRIAYGVRNIALNTALDRPAAAPQPGDFTVDVALHSTAYLIRKGHRLRLALSQAMWPIVLGDAKPGAMTLQAGEIALPFLKIAPEPLVGPFPAVVDLPPVKSHQTLQDPALERWKTENDSVKAIGWHQPLTAVHYDQTDTTFAFETRMEHRLETGDHPVLMTQVCVEMQFNRPDGKAVIATTLESCKSADQWKVSVSFSASWQDEEIAAANWQIEPDL